MIIDECGLFPIGIRLDDVGDSTQQKGALVKAARSPSTG
jgi:hypothetical protein